jgi:hypothetical protein
VGGFWGDAWTSFKAVYGPILAVAAFVLALLGPFYAPGAPVQIGVMWLAVGAVFGLTVAMTTVDMLQSARRLARHQTSKVIHVTTDPPPFEGQSDLVTLVLDRSSIFTPAHVVTIGYAAPFGSGQILEQRIGIGYVHNLQENGFVQIRVVKMVSKPDELWQRIKNRDLPTLAQIVVRPSVAIDDVELGDSLT